MTEDIKLQIFNTTLLNNCLPDFSTRLPLKVDDLAGLVAVWSFISRREQIENMSGLIQPISQQSTESSREVGNSSRRVVYQNVTLNYEHIVDHF